MSAFGTIDGRDLCREDRGFPSVGAKPFRSIGYKNSEDRIFEMDKLECYRLGWVRLV